MLNNLSPPLLFNYFLRILYLICICIENLMIYTFIKFKLQYVTCNTLYLRTTQPFVNFLIGTPTSFFHQKKTSGPGGAHVRCRFRPGGGIQQNPAQEARPVPEQCATSQSDADGGPGGGLNVQRWLQLQRQRWRWWQWWCRRWICWQRFRRIR